jgi:hypothetical protein
MPASFPPDVPNPPRILSQEDIFLWPDGTKCFAFEADQLNYKPSGDYERIEFGSDRWAQLVDLS